MSFGRLDRAPSSQPMSDINMTPLIDVMLVLVVIFIITAPLMVSSIKLDLPQTEAAQANDVAKSITVVVDAAGQTYVNDLPVTLVDLSRQLALSKKANADTEVQLRADKAVPYGRMVEVMGVAQKVGLSRIGFVADSVSSQPSTPPASTLNK